MTVLKDGHERNQVYRSIPENGRKAGMSCTLIFLQSVFTGLILCCATGQQYFAQIQSCTSADWALKALWIFF